MMNGVIWGGEEIKGAGGQSCQVTSLRGVMLVQDIQAIFDCAPVLSRVLLSPCFRFY